MVETFCQYVAEYLRAIGLDAKAEGRTVTVGAVEFDGNKRGKSVEFAGYIYRSGAHPELAAQRIVRALPQKLKDIERRKKQHDIDKELRKIAGGGTASYNGFEVEPGLHVKRSYDDTCHVLLQTDDLKLVRQVVDCVLFLKRGDTSMDERLALVRAILDCPEENTVSLVYADWLDENDMPERAAAIREACS